MKAKEAPKKIYLEKVYPDNGILPNGLNYNQSPTDIEYVRTDAFIEKACEFLDGCIPDYIDLKHANIDTFIDIDNKRFIEEFRTYMKGE